MVQKLVNLLDQKFRNSGWSKITIIEWSENLQASNCTKTMNGPTNDKLWMIQKLKNIIWSKILEALDLLASWLQFGSQLFLIFLLLFHFSSLQEVFIALFAFIPGELMFGGLVDSSCTLWSAGGSCSSYNTTTLRWNTISHLISILILSQYDHSQVLGR